MFKAGTEMFIDHPTETEEWERPERSIRDYAGVFLEDATVGEDGALYTVCKVFSGVNELIKDKWEHIGVSINAWCADPISENGIVPPIAGVRSVDFVTTPGAGGTIVDLLESNRNDNYVKEAGMDKEIESKFDELKASLIELSALSSKLLWLLFRGPRQKSLPERHLSMLIRFLRLAAGLLSLACRRLLSCVFVRP